MEAQQILSLLNQDIKAFDKEFPQLSTMIESAGMQILPLAELTPVQQAYAKKFHIATQPDELVVRWVDMLESSIYSSIGMALIEWYTDQDFSGGFPEEIPDNGTIFDLDEDYNIKGIESILRFDYAYGESTSLATLKEFGIKS